MVKGRRFDPYPRQSTDTQLKVLRTGAVIFAVWSCIFALIQIGIMGWQLKVVRDLQYELDNRQVPMVPGDNTYRARFPGIYQRFTETPERRRVNTLSVIALVNLIVTILHFVLSIVLLYGTVLMQRNCIWPWFMTVVASILMSTAYAVIWWSGDVFNEQLTMTYIEFLMAIAINSIALGWMVFYYLRLSGINLFNRKRRMNKKKPPNAAGKAPLLQPQWREYSQDGTTKVCQPQWNGQMNTVPRPQQTQPIGHPKVLSRQPQQSAVRQPMQQQSQSKTYQVSYSNGNTLPNQAGRTAQMTQQSNQLWIPYEQHHAHYTAQQRLQHANPIEYQQNLAAKQQRWNPHQQSAAQPWNRPPQLQPITAPPQKLPTPTAYQSQHHGQTLPPERCWQAGRRPQ